MKLQYEKKIIEQALNFLNEISVSGLGNIEKLASVSALLSQYKVIEDKELEGGEKSES